MTENSFPFENADTTEAQFAKWASALVGSGVISGLVASASGGMNVSIATGAAMVRGVYYENITSANVLTVDAANVTARKDAIVLRNDLTANSIIAAVKKGSTSGGGTLPALTQTSATWEHLIAEITVLGGATNLLDDNIVTRLAGTGLRVLDYFTADRPAPSDAVAIGVNKTAKIVELWVSGAWNNLTPALTWSNVSSKPTTFAPIIGGGADQAVAGNDSRLSDARTPTAHTHDDRYYTKAQVDALLGGRKYTASSSAPDSPSTGDLWDELT